MAYNATYANSDIAPVSIDAIVGIISVAASFATLIGLVIVYRFMKHGKL